MAGLLQAVKARVGVMKEQVSSKNIKTHFTIDKIIVFILIALLWGFSTVPLFLFYLTPASQNAAEELPMTMLANMTQDANYEQDANVTQMDTTLPGCNFTSRGTFYRSVGTIKHGKLKGNTTTDGCINENFYYDETTNLCAPNCYTWTSYTPATAVTIDGLVLFCSCVATLTCIAVIIIACVHRKAVFKFPSVLVFYMSLSCLLFNSVTLIGYVDKHELYCSSKNMLDNLLSPTPYCILAGAVTDYYLIQLSIWVFFHILSIYFLIFYPLQAKQLLNSSKLKYVHLCVVLIGLLAPLLGPLTTILHNLSDQEDPERLGYRVLLYPPQACVNTRTRIAFYIATLPSNFLLTLSTSFLILVFWKLLKGKQTTEATIGTAEKKILVTLCYYTLLNLILPTTAVLLAGSLTQFAQEAAAFFVCASANGISEPLQLDKVLNPAFVIVGWFLQPVLPLFLLAYVVDCQRLKKCVMKKDVEFPAHWTSTRSQMTTKSQAT